MTVQELIDKLEEIDDKSKTVCVIGVDENIFIDDVEENTDWNRVHLVCNLMPLSYQVM